MNKLPWLLLCLLSACAEDVTLIPRVAGVGAGYTPYPMSKQYQKRDQIGHTDPDQRREDMIACGLPRERYNDDLSYYGGGPRSETNGQYLAREKKFKNCMRKEKGYIIFGGASCGPAEKNWGICEDKKP